MNLLGYAIKRRGTVLTWCDKTVVRRGTRWAWRNQETHKYAGAISISPDRPTVRMWWGLRVRVDRVVDSWTSATCEACKAKRYLIPGLRGLRRSRRR